MIRLRRMLERGSAHPVLGPILLIVLVLLLSMLFLHIAQDGHDAATEIGAVCLALATMLGLSLLERLPRRLLEPIVAVRGDRGPPQVGDGRIARPAVVAACPRSLPLRR